MISYLSNGINLSVYHDKQEVVFDKFGDSSIKRVSALSNKFTTTESNNYTLFSYQSSELIDETDWIQLGQTSF